MLVEQPQALVRNKEGGRNVVASALFPTRQVVPQCRALPTLRLASGCGSLGRAHKTDRHILPPPGFVSRECKRELRSSRVQAEGKDGGQPTEAPQGDDDAEARLEALERGAKRKKGAQTVVADARLRAKRNEPVAGGLAEWKEGKLFPEGWEKMSLPQKLYELYTGKRGFLYWSAQSAWYSVFILGGGWVVFRFILPALGIYQLTNDLQSPPNL